MIRISSVLILIVLIVVSFGCKKVRTDIVYDKSYMNEIKLARKDCALFIIRNSIPGANFAIGKDNKIIYSEGMGFASKDLDVVMSRENKLRIGDLSELFTDIIYLKLVEEEVLHPDSTVQYYIPDYPETGSKLAIKHLPYHTSGIRREETSERNMSGQNITIQKGLEIFKNDELNSPTGWFKEMSMFNSNLLGAVMEKATNKKFRKLLKEYVTDSLYLTNTVVDSPFDIIQGRTDFYDLNYIGQCINAPFMDMGYKAPSIGILSNAEDLVKFGMAILESEYFSDEFKENIFKPIVLNSGYKSDTANGWSFMLDEQGRTMYVSSGSVIGGGAILLIYPEEKLVIAGAVNLTHSHDNIPVFEIANHFLQDSKSDEKQK